MNKIVELLYFVLKGHDESKAKLKLHTSTLLLGGSCKRTFIF
uniref:Uncharacterized protein n=1 Tax=Anguilla anguilla TaxID=7936 RepID=A0A0E9Q8P6_ANGAN